MLLGNQITVSTSNRKIIVTVNVHDNNIDFLKSHHEGARQKNLADMNSKKKSKSPFRLWQKLRFQMTNARRHRMNLTCETSEE